VIVGAVGLGNMGAALADNLVAAGLDVVATDLAGPTRCPTGATFVDDVTAVARRADVVVVSVPDGPASHGVADEVVAAEVRRTTVVVDTSTIGPAAAGSIAALLGDAGVGYVDAPVSGGVAGARARTLAVMYSGGDDACRAAEPVLAGLSDRRHRIGDRPGMAQAMKLANNFLSATALAATSEAVAFGRRHGLDLATMLEVLNASSGRSSATQDKFPEHVLTGRFASGFTSSLMAKDVALYLGEAGEGPVGPAVARVWRAFADAEPGVDFTRIAPFVESELTSESENP